MSEERNHIKVFVSSTVYDFETDLRRILPHLMALDMMSICQKRALSHLIADYQIS